MTRDVPWLDTLETIRQLQSDLMRVMPHRDAGLVPNPAARPAAINAAERRIGMPLPPSYRAFLERHDGWPRFFDGATLLGTRDLGKKTYAELARAALDATETPVSADGPPSRIISGKAGDLLPFGIDPDGTTLFAFDPRARRADGEMPVLAWMHELGLRFDSFPALLRAIVELCEADASGLTEDAWRETA
jgi:hypothetical protein